MNILERTTTEEYDEDGRLTSRTTVEKYGDGGLMLPLTKEEAKQLKCEFGIDCPIAKDDFIGGDTSKLREQCPLWEYESLARVYRDGNRTTFEIFDLYCKHLEDD